MRTTIAAIITATSLGACATPEQSLEFAQGTCAFIGYDMSRERVPTLQCTERKYDQHQARGKTAATGLVVGLATVAVASAMQPTIPTLP